MRVRGFFSKMIFVRACVHSRVHLRVFSRVFARVLAYAFACACFSIRPYMFRSVSASQTPHRLQLDESIIVTDDRLPLYASLPLLIPVLLLLPLPLPLPLLLLLIPLQVKLPPRLPLLLPH